MDKKSSRWVFLKYNYQRTMANPRTYCAGLGLLAVLTWFYRYLPSYLAKSHATMNVFEMYVLNSNSIDVERYILLGLLLLIADIPFLVNGLQYYILRAHRRDWLEGQVLYLGSLVILYNLFLFLVFILSTGLHVHLADSWSTVVDQALRTTLIPDALRDLCYMDKATWMKLPGPVEAMGITLIWNCLWMFALSMGHFFLSIWHGSRVAWLFTGGAFLLDLGYRQDIFGGYVTTKLFAHASPLTMSRWIFLKDASRMPSVWYALAFYLLLILAAWIGCRQYVMQFDMDMSKQ